MESIKRLFNEVRELEIETKELAKNYPAGNVPQEEINKLQTKVEKLKSNLETKK